MEEKIIKIMQLQTPELLLWSYATWQMVSGRIIQEQKNFACGQKTTPQNLNCKKQLRLRNPI